MSGMAELLREAMRPQEARKEPGRDNRLRRPVFDGAETALPGAVYVQQDMKIKVATAIQSWCETDDLGTDETSAMRLQSLLIGIVDANKDGEIGEEEADYFDALLEYAWDYLASKGVPEDDIDTLLNDWDDATADRVMDLVNGELPDGDEQAMEDINAFAFDDSAESSVFDSAVYKNHMAIRGGRKVRIKKRTSGTIRHSAAQKVAIRKMLMKSHSASAQLHRSKSMRVRKNMGL